MSRALDETKRAKARRLRAQGLSFREIGERVGASTGGVQYWLMDPAKAEAKREAMKLRNETYKSTEYRGGRPTSSTCASCNGRHHPDDCEEAIRATCRCGLSLFTNEEKARGSCNDCLPTNAASFAATRMVATGNSG